MFTSDKYSHNLVGKLSWKKNTISFSFSNMNFWSLFVIISGWVQTPSFIQKAIGISQEELLENTLISRIAATTFLKRDFSIIERFSYFHYKM